MRLRLDVQTWPRASAKMPMTWPHDQSGGVFGHAGSTAKIGTPLNAGAGVCAAVTEGGVDRSAS